MLTPVASPLQPPLPGFDLADAQDPEWPADSVIGVVIGVRRGGRTFSTGSLEGRLRSWWSRAIPLRWRR